MKESNTKRNIVLSILFFLPVAFLLMLYPAKHNYTPLDIINNDVKEISEFTSNYKDAIQLADHITVLGFIGNNPSEDMVAISNLKELVYDKFLGFKKFQLVLVAPYGTEDEVKELHKELVTFEELKFWHYIHGSETEIKNLYKSLKVESPLKDDLSVNDVFIIDKDLNQRGRLDARTKKQIENKKPVTTLSAYDCIDVDVIKNKMSEDIRILFTEYRQKRKGNFDSNTRREQVLKK